jgi:GT2 family glycosyltransferase
VSPPAVRPSVTVSVLAFHSRRTIEACVRSVLAQRYEGEVDLWVRDQGGDDEEYELLETLARDAEAAGLRTVLERGENLGFAAGHNRAIRASTAELFLPLNADAVLDPDFLEHAVAALRHDRIGAVQGKLLLWDQASGGPALGPAGGPMIDTCGLTALRSRRFVSRGVGEEDVGQFDDAEPPFAADGAAPLLVRRAIEDVAVPFRAFAGPEVEGVEYFDEAFFAYKEDVDLGWRLRLRGWSTAWAPAAVAWHDRGAPDIASSGLALLRHRFGRRSHAWYLGFSNQRLMQVKNDGRRDLRPDLHRWLARELLAWTAGAVSQREFVASVRRLVRELRTARRKRAWIQSRRTAEAADWFR